MKSRFSGLAGGASGCLTLPLAGDEFLKRTSPLVNPERFFSTDFL